MINLQWRQSKDCIIFFFEFFEFLFSLSKLSFETYQTFQIQMKIALLQNMLRVQGDFKSKYFVRTERTKVYVEDPYSIPLDSMSDNFQQKITSNTSWGKTQTLYSSKVTTIKSLRLSTARVHNFNYGPNWKVALI